MLRWAARLACDAIVIEAMSIRPESLRAELGQILRPHTVVVTNTFEDHLAEMTDPAAVFSDAVPAGAMALLPSDFPASEQARLAKRSVPYRVIATESGEDRALRLPHPEWPQNLALALAACERAGVGSETALRGMAGVRMDVGVLGAWILPDPVSGAAAWTAINGFAANDPHSALMALQRALAEWPKDGGGVVGLLNLRPDRADRTAQWMEGLRAFDGTVCGLVVCGSVPRIVRHRLARTYGKRVSVVVSKDPERIMDAVVRLCPEGGYVFGCGNIGGAGIRLVEYWQEKGEPA